MSNTKVMCYHISTMNWMQSKTSAKRCAAMISTSKTRARGLNPTPSGFTQILSNDFPILSSAVELNAFQILQFGCRTESLGLEELVFSVAKLCASG
jgi:hypothetical protein